MCAHSGGFFKVVAGVRGWRGVMVEIAYPCPWTTSSFAFRREAIALLVHMASHCIQVRRVHTMIVVCP